MFLTLFSPSFRDTEAYSDLIGNICMNEVTPANRKITHCGRPHIDKEDQEKEKSLLQEVQTHDDKKTLPEYKSLDGEAWN